MGDEPQDEPTAEEEQPQEKQPEQPAKPDEQPPPSPDDPLRRTEAFYAERMTTLRPKNIQQEAEVPPEIFVQQMEEYRRRQQEQAGEVGAVSPEKEDSAATGSSHANRDQEEEDA